MDQKKYFFLLLILVSITFLFRFNTFGLPLDRDEGSYLYMGKALLNGYIPYLDFYELKPPGLYYSYALFDLLFGQSIESLHFGLFVLNAFSILLLFHFVTNYFNSNLLAFCSSLAFGLLSLSPFFQGHSILSEHFLIFYFLLGLSFLSLYLKNKSSVLLFLSAISFSWMLLNKQHGIILLLIPISILVSELTKNRLKPLPCLGIFILGLIIPGLIILFISWIQGYFDQMIYWILTRNFQSENTSVGFDSGYGYFIFHFKLIWRNNIVLISLFFIGIIVQFLSLKRQVFTSLIFIIFSFIAVLPTMRFYLHYWIVFLPAISLFIALFCFWLIQNLQRWGFVVLAVLLIIALIELVPFYFLKTDEEKTTTIYGNNLVYEIKQMAEFIAPKLGNEDDLFIFGSEPQLYYYLDYLSWTEHVYLAHLFEPFPENSNIQTELMSEIRRKDPEFLIFVNHPFSWSLKSNSDLRLFYWAKSLLKENYDIIGSIEQNQFKFDFKSSFSPNYEPKSEIYLAVYKRK